jgi:hypothetical protein
MSMPMDQPRLPNCRKILADKAEFNHHLAGFFVIVAGIFILFQSILQKVAAGLLAGIVLTQFSFWFGATGCGRFGHRQ